MHQHNTVVPVCYRPPDTTLRDFDTALARLDEVLSDLPVPTPTIALMGDFNFPAPWAREDGALLPQVAGHRQVESVGAAFNWLMATLLPLLEELVPARRVGKERGKRRVDKQRRPRWCGRS